jgi:hypothetical protein
LLPSSRAEKVCRVNRWTGVLFAVGSLCFLVAPFPGFADLVGGTADGIVFFVGSIFFTSAGFLQWLGARHDPAAFVRAAAIIQLAGTLFFNRSTYAALNDSLSAAEQDHVIWRPDALGSICFLVASWLAWRAARHQAPVDRRMGLINLAGSVFFGISAVAAYVLPSTGEALSLPVVNLATAAGALCFLIGAVWLART